MLTKMVSYLFFGAFISHTNFAGTAGKVSFAEFIHGMTEIKGNLRHLARSAPKPNKPKQKADKKEPEVPSKPKKT